MYIFARVINFMFTRAFRTKHDMVLCNTFRDFRIFYNNGYFYIKKKHETNAECNHQITVINVAFYIQVCLPKYVFC